MDDRAVRWHDERMILLETPRLRLRRFTADDVDRLVELDSDPEVMRYITFGEPTPREAVRRGHTCRAGLRSTRRSRGLGTSPPRIAHTDEFLGWFHLRDDRIEPEYRRTGLSAAPRGLGQRLRDRRRPALVRHGFAAALPPRRSGPHARSATSPRSA